ncbi:MAG: FMN-binding protein [Eubacterium sp.]
MKKAHFNPKSLNWLISLAVMIVVCVGVIFGSKAIYEAANKKYNEPVEIPFTVASTLDADISSTNAADLGISSVKEAYDSSNKLVAYVVEGQVIGYNQSSPIVMASTISADGTLVCGIEIIDQDETEYLGEKIDTPEFQAQFDGRYLPVVVAGGTDKGSKIDAISGATISSKAVIQFVNNAQQFVVDNYVPESAAE